MIRARVAVASFTLLALLTSACGADHPGEHCVRRHTEYVPIYCGTGCVTFVPNDVCDKWVPNKPSDKPSEPPR